MEAARKTTKDASSTGLRPSESDSLAESSEKPVETRRNQLQTLSKGNDTKLTHIGQSLDRVHERQEQARADAARLPKAFH